MADWYKDRTGSASGRGTRPRTETMQRTSRREERSNKSFRRATEEEDKEEEEEEAEEAAVPKSKTDPKPPTVKKSMPTKELTGAVIGVEKLSLNNSQQIRAMGISDYSITVLTKDTDKLIVAVEDGWAKYKDVKDEWNESEKTTPPQLETAFKLQGMLLCIEQQVQESPLIETELNTSWNEMYKKFVLAATPEDMLWIAKSCKYSSTRAAREQQEGRGQACGGPPESQLFDQGHQWRVGNPRDGCDDYAGASSFGLRGKERNTRTTQNRSCNPIIGFRACEGALVILRRGEEENAASSGERSTRHGQAPSSEPMASQDGW
jgi:hypothetical protein